MLLAWRPHLEYRLHNLYTTIFKEKTCLFCFFFRQRGREGETEGEKQQCVVASCEPPTGDLAHNPGMCPDWESNQQSFILQAGAQSTEPHQPGQKYVSSKNLNNSNTHTYIYYIYICKNILFFSITSATLLSYPCGRPKLLLPIPTTDNPPATLLVSHSLSPTQSLINLLIALAGSMLSSKLPRASISTHPESRFKEEGPQGPQGWPEEPVRATRHSQLQTLITESLARFRPGISLFPQTFPLKQ